MNEALDFPFIFDLANFDELVDEIKKMNIDLIENRTQSDDFILTFDALMRALNDLDVIVHTKEIAHDVETETITRLIRVHRELLEYRHHERLEKNIIAIMNRLSMLYPLYMMSVSFSQNVEVEQ